MMASRTTDSVNLVTDRESRHLPFPPLAYCENPEFEV